ncbi:hypothetical protein [Streptosporangium pseudovulgare]|uniref:hypothetical protein n=1 Tax=Streptosporangium pseudovulgare TaxID=35765 RepID=UPI001670CAC5|nr:hypothetical protein [Streptosporangium pseudovulgare]
MHLRLGLGRVRVPPLRAVRRGRRAVRLLRGLRLLSRPLAAGLSAALPRPLTAGLSTGLLRPLTIGPATGLSRPLAAGLLRGPGLPGSAGPLAGLPVRLRSV